MNPDLDPTDGMISRSALAANLLLFRMKQLSEDLHCASWLNDLEFLVWDMAYGGENAFGDIKVSDQMAKSFRDLADLSGGWWVYKDKTLPDEHGPVFISMERWLQVLAEQEKI